MGRASKGDAELKNKSAMIVYLFVFSQSHKKHMRPSMPIFRVILLFFFGGGVTTEIGVQAPMFRKCSYLTLLSVMTPVSSLYLTSFLSAPVSIRSPSCYSRVCCDWSADVGNVSSLTMTRFGDSGFLSSWKCCCSWQQRCFSALPVWPRVGHRNLETTVTIMLEAMVWSWTCTGIESSQAKNMIVT